MTHSIRNIVVLVLVFLAGAGLAQKPIALYDNTNLYREALDLFEHEKYVPAKEKFEQYILAEKNPQNALRINSEYYSGICALYLLHKDAEYQLEKFVLEHPDSPWKQHVYFELATFNYKKKSYKKAIEWFEYVDEKNLSAQDKIEFRYKRGHSRFETGDLSNARQDFYEAKQSESEYRQAAVYYYSHIAYEQNDLQTALDGFLTLEKDAIFKGLVPFYITQIYYKQKRYDEVLVYGPKALSEAEANATKRVPEISRLIGDAYCVREKYADALPFLLRYHENTPKGDITREDYYQLGYVYHKTSAWQKAIDAYSNCSLEDDDLTQRVSYNMGECYLKLNQKEYARNAFESASKMTHIPDVQEDAMLNYAKLAFELSYNPFHEAITAFEDYLNKYPNSKRRDEAYEFLLNVYMKTKNYDKALASLDKIQNKDNRVKEAYQVVAYNRAVELFQSEKFTQADPYFDKVAAYPVNPTLNADARYWKAEISYRTEQFVQAAQRYVTFINEPGAYNSEYYGLAHYSQGYAYFKMANKENNYETASGFYEKANTSFRKYVDGNHGKESDKVNDAYLRIGDCFYVGKNYTQAILYYDKAISANASGKDYAMYQKAITYGFDGQNDKKAWVLKSLLTDIPGSKFEIDAKYELAKTYLTANRLSDSKNYYNDILTNHKSSQYVKYALRDLCLVYVKEGNEDKVRETWNTLKSAYPRDGVLKDAYVICKSVLIDDPDFQSDAISIGGASKDEVEEEVYLKAVGYAQDGDCNTAITKLNAYLQKFRYYALEAHYYLANCYFNKGDKENALNSYNYVIAQGSSNYLEECLVVAATINYNKKDYSAARTHYQKLSEVAVLKNNVLEAQIGLMRCNYLLNDFTAAKQYADQVLTNVSTPQEIRYTALLWRGRIQMGNGQYDAAMADFKEVMKKGGVDAAEAKWSTANCIYLKGDYKKAETEIFSLLEKYSSFDEWKFKGYLLLADVYIGLKDYFQARATVNAILENVEEPWVVEQALAKKKQLDDLENAGRSQKSGDIEININPQN